MLKKLILDKEKVTAAFNNSMLLIHLGIKPSENKLIESLNILEQKEYVKLLQSYFLQSRGINKYELLKKDIEKDRQLYPEGIIQYRDLLEKLLGKDDEIDVYFGPTFNGQSQPEAHRRINIFFDEERRSIIAVNEQNELLLEQAVAYLNKIPQTSFTGIIKKDLTSKYRYEIYFIPK